MYFKHEKCALVTVQQRIKETHVFTGTASLGSSWAEPGQQCYSSLEPLSISLKACYKCLLFLDLFQHTNHLLCLQKHLYSTGYQLPVQLTSCAAKGNEQFLFPPVKKWGWRSPSGDTSGKDRLQEDSEPTSWRGGVVAPHRQHEQG